MVERLRRLRTRAPNPTNVAFLYATTVGLWIALWGDLSWANVLSGLALATAVNIVLPVVRESHGGRLRPFRAMLYFGLMTVLLTKASLEVANIVIRRKRISPGIIAVEFPHATPALINLLTNSIVLTPGTIVVDVRTDPCVLVVHVLDVEDIEAARRSIRELILLALEAFGPATAAEDITRLRSELREQEATS